MSATSDLELIVYRKLSHYSATELNTLKRTCLKNLVAANEMAFELTQIMCELCPDPVEVKRNKSDLKYALETRSIILAELRSINKKLNEIEIEMYTEGVA